MEMMMNRKLSIWTTLVIATCFSSFALANDSVFGASAAKINASPSVEEMMKYSIQDEFLAQAEYDLIIQKFGAVRPFTNIIKAEGKHISLLVEAYKQRNLDLPENDAVKFVTPPASLHKAIAVGVQAEIDNIAMYESFLQSPLLAKQENTDLKKLFTLLMNASQNHLSAFNRNLKKYK
jgi:hypothetical protein